MLFVLRFRGGLSWAAAAVVTFPTLPRRQRAETSTQYLRAAAVNAWARRRANVKLSDAGLALGRLLGELAGKTGCYPCALSVNFCPNIGAGEPGLAARRREPARRVVSEVRSAGHCDSVPCAVMCLERNRVKNRVKRVKSSAQEPAG